MLWIRGVERGLCCLQREVLLLVMVLVALQVLPVLLMEAVRMMLERRPARLRCDGSSGMVDAMRLVWAAGDSVGRSWRIRVSAETSEGVRSDGCIFAAFLCYLGTDFT